MEVKEFKAGQFALIEGEGLAKDGLPGGTIVYLAGETLLRESEDDPYLLRRAFLAAKVVDYHIQVEDKPFLITNKNLAPVEDFELAALEEVYHSDFAPKEEVDEEDFLSGVTCNPDAPEECESCQ
ncbi:hypothetical protein [Pseudomonas phage GP100]|nr:hypothetical protein [Pseudomonas phage GP100]